MENQNTKNINNISCSVGMISGILVLLCLFLTQTNLSEDGQYSVIYYIIITFTLLQTGLSLLIKKNYKTPAFWLMIITITGSLILSGLLWYVTLLGRSFNH